MAMEILSARLDAIPCKVEDVELDHDAKAQFGRRTSWRST
jgi:hypothetical protein